jgi:hypothetical protein
MERLGRLGRRGRGEWFRRREKIRNTGKSFGGFQCPGIEKRCMTAFFKKVTVIPETELY